MTCKEIFYYINDKLKKRYDNRTILLSKNGSSNTIIFSAPSHNYKKQEYSILLEEDEYPILQCTEPNGNFFLMSTCKMYSYYNQQSYVLPYKDYWWHDRIIFSQNLPIEKGKTKTFKYYSLNSEEFWYEIDSGQPADAAHGCILYYMRMLNRIEPPDLSTLPDRGTI